VTGGREGGREGRRPRERETQTADRETRSLRRERDSNRDKSAPLWKSCHGVTSTGGAGESDSGVSVPGPGTYDQISLCTVTGCFSMPPGDE
jgi:hypothetical protein